MHTLYYAPATCALGIHVLLEEIGKPYGLKKIDLSKQEQHSPDYKKINPKSKVPALLREDGTVLTEYPAVATWLALSNPEKRLLSSDHEEMVRTLEATNYVTGTLHVLGFTRMWLPRNFTPNEADYPEVQKKGREIVENGLALFNRDLEGRDYVRGDHLTIADSALFYLEFWITYRLKEPLPPNCAAHYRRMTARPAVQRVLASEGFA